MMPFTIFGYRFTTCHVLPALAMLALLALSLFPVFALVSHYVPPVQLTSIWLEKSVFTAAEVASGEAEFTLRKSGKWRRFCPVDAQQTFINETGTVSLDGEIHQVDFPRAAADGTTLQGKPRKKPDIVPKILAGSSGKWRLRLVNINGACWPWEHLWPIVPSEPVEATFEIQ